MLFRAVTPEVLGVANTVRVVWFDRSESTWRLRCGGVLRLTSTILLLFAALLPASAGRAADAESVLIKDQLPAELELFVEDFGTPGPILFVDGTTRSGVEVNSISLANDLDDLDFDDGSANWVLDPVADVDGFESSVTAIRVRPTGTPQGSSGTPPSFEIRFRARTR